MGSRLQLKSLWEELPVLYKSNKQVIGKAVAANMNILAKALKGNISSTFNFSTPVDSGTPQHEKESSSTSWGEAYNELVADEFDIMETWVYLNPKNDKDGYDPYSGQSLSDEEQQEVLKNKVDYIKGLGVKKVSILDPDNLPFTVK